jgi:hypothetical protein
MNEVEMVLDIAKTLAPELLELAQYAANDSRDPGYELKLAMRLIRKATDAQAQQQLTR